jgi:Asp/Glu/hydantoin racemase
MTNITKRNVAFIHTSPAAIAPLMQFYSVAAPELEITNLLDDGLLRLLAARKQSIAGKRLADMIEAARETYASELAMITCSSVSKEIAEALNDNFDLPVLKIDYPMARQAVSIGKRIGVAATFSPTLEPTTRLLYEAAEEAGTTIEIIREVAPEAYEALLTNNYQEHDELLLAAIKQLEQQDASVIVLAQVSMARILPSIESQIAVPVLSSLHTSLDAIREAFSQPTRS